MVFNLLDCAFKALYEASLFIFNKPLGVLGWGGSLAIKISKFWGGIYAGSSDREVLSPNFPLQCVLYTIHFGLNADVMRAVDLLMGEIA